MNTLLKIILSVSLVVALSSCGNKNKPEETDLTAPKGMRYFDMSRTGMNAYILLPDSTFGTIDTVMQSNGEYIIKVGKDYQVAVTEGDGDINQKKADLAGDDVNKLKKYLVDDKSSLMWESGIGDLSEFHFYHVVKLGNRSYVFEDVKGEPFSQQSAQKMYDACKQTKEKKIAGKES